MFLKKILNFFLFYILLNSHFLIPNIWESLKDAIRADDIEQFNFLILQRPKSVNEQDKFGMTLLMFAAVNGSIKILERLVELGAFVDVENDFSLNRTALSIAQGRYNFYKEKNVLIEVKTYEKIIKILSSENIIEIKKVS